MTNDVLVCPICGEVVNEEDLGTIANQIEGTPYTEYLLDDSCPCCGHQLDKGVKCCSCGEWVADECCYDDMCEDCLKKSISVENIVEYVKDCGEEVEWQKHLENFVMEAPEGFVTFLKEKFKL